MAFLPQDPTPLAKRAAQLGFELLFSGTTSFLLTSAILPLFGLHPASLTVLRVTGISTLVVFAVLDVLVGALKRFRAESRPAVTDAVVPDENPKFTLSPAGRWRDAEAGWPDRKV
ncbi:hypothetical protein DFH06DRAFT_612281 [Mycena polygramma]|nr:hypothetical protein DFH06DRAFT_612281 [Mycena polygramma]